MNDDEHLNSEVDDAGLAKGNSKRAAKKKPIKKVSEGYLERAALHYLGRFSSSEHNLSNVLERKVRRRNEGLAPATDEQKKWISNVVAKCLRFGYVDDAQYAKQRADGLLRKGKPTRIILQDLRFKGIDEKLASQVISNLSDSSDITPDTRAAAAYVKRRRFGPFRRDHHNPEEKREKEIVAMMRAGFRYDLVKATLEMSEGDIIDLLM